MSMHATLHRPESVTPKTAGGTYWVEIKGEGGAVVIFFKDPSDIVRQMNACLDAALEMERAQCIR